MILSVTAYQALPIAVVIVFDHGPAVHGREHYRLT